jgi:hypothetical protein
LRESVEQWTTLHNSFKPVTTSDCLPYIHAALACTLAYPCTAISPNTILRRSCCPLGPSCLSFQYNTIQVGGLKLLPALACKPSGSWEIKHIASTL